MSREYGRGSIVSFIVVGVLLVALVLGGLYLVKNQLGTWLGSQPVQEASDDVREIARDTTESDDEPATDNTADDEASAPQEEPAPSNDEDTSNDSTDDAATPADDSTDATDDDADGVTDDNSRDEDDMPTTGVELPQTGLGDSLLTMLPVTALVAAAVAYRRSGSL